MHETRFINEIFTALKQKIGQGHSLAKAVVHVRLSPFSHVTPEALQSIFKELAKVEGFKNARLDVLPLEILIECKNCKKTTGVTKKVFACPACNSANVSLQMDREFSVESIDIQ